MVVNWGILGAVEDEGEVEGEDEDEGLSFAISKTIADVWQTCSIAMANVWHCYGIAIQFCC